MNLRHNNVDDFDDPVVHALQLENKLLAKRNATLRLRLLALGGQRHRRKHAHQPCGSCPEEDHHDASLATSCVADIQGERDTLGSYQFDRLDNSVAFADPFDDNERGDDTPPAAAAAAASPSTMESPREGVSSVVAVCSSCATTAASLERLAAHVALVTAEVVPLCGGASALLLSPNTTCPDSATPAMPHAFQRLTHALQTMEAAFRARTAAADTVVNHLQHDVQRVSHEQADSTARLSGMLEEIEQSSRRSKELEVALATATEQMIESQNMCAGLTGELRRSNEALSLTESQLRSSEMHLENARERNTILEKALSRLERVYMTSNVVSGLTNETPTEDKQIEQHLRVELFHAVKREQDEELYVNAAMEAKKKQNVSEETSEGRSGSRGHNKVTTSLSPSPSPHGVTPQSQMSPSPTALSFGCERSPSWHPGELPASFQVNSLAREIFNRAMEAMKK